MPTIRPSVKPPSAKSNNPIITSPPSKTCLRVCIVSFLPLLLRFPVTIGGGNAKERGDLDRVHPTQKPISLYEWLLMNYTKEGDKILDTHLGSGSIAIACHNLGYELTACELDKDYYEASYKRFKQVTSQTKLF